MTELTTSQKKRVDWLYRCAQDVSRLMANVTRADLAILVYRESLSPEPDGHSTNKRPKFGGGGSDTTPTEAAMLQLLEYRATDPQGQAIKIAMGLLPLLTRAASTIDKEIRFVTTTGFKERGREDSLSYCECCGGPVTNTERDRIRAGLGPRCYDAMIHDRKLAAKHQTLFERSLWLIERSAIVAAGDKPKCGEMVMASTTPPCA